MSLSIINNLNAYQLRTTFILRSVDLRLLKSPGLTSFVLYTSSHTLFSSCSESQDPLKEYYCYKQWILRKALSVHNLSVAGKSLPCTKHIHFKSTSTYPYRNHYLSTRHLYVTSTLYNSNRLVLNTITLVKYQAPKPLICSYFKSYSYYQYYYTYAAHFKFTSHFSNPHTLVWASFTNITATLSSWNYSHRTFYSTFHNIKHL